MNFQDLLSKIQAIDTADNAPVETQTTECGDTMAPESPMMAPTMPPKEKEEATMNVNITAKGDAIDDVLKLMTKVNPDMINQPEPPEMPTMTIMSPGMDGPMGDMDGPEGPPMPKPINKLLPDFDGDNDDMPGGEKDSMDLPKDHDKDHVMIKALDKDGDDDHDMDDHDMEKDDDKEDKKDKEEAYANEPDEDERDIDYMTNKMSGGMNRRKGTHPKVAGGDNAMQRVKEGEELRASIRSQLLKALEETKGAK